jgi:hypothetical protein
VENLPAEKKFFNKHFSQMANLCQRILIELDHHQKESSDTVQKTQDRRPVDIEVSGSCEFWYIS